MNRTRTKVRRLSRREFLVTSAGAGIGLLVLSSCGSNEESGNTATIRLFDHSQELYQEGTPAYELLQQFMEEHPQIEVEISGASSDQFDSALLSLASSDDLPDIFSTRSSIPFSQLLEEDFIQPIEGLVSTEFVEKFPEAAFVEGVNVSDGEIYSFPRNIARYGRYFFYNKDVMEQAGLDPDQPPTTWGELREMSRTVTREIDGVYGLVFPFEGEDNTGFEDILSLALGRQPTLSVLDGFDYQQGRYEFTSPSVLEAYEFVRELKDEGLIHPNSPTYGLADAQGAFANKQAAFMINQEWGVSVYTESLGATDYDVTSMPVPEEGIEYHQPLITASWSNWISATTEYPEEAGAVIEVLGSEERLRREIEETLRLSPIPELNENAENEQLRHMTEAFQNTAVERPVPLVKPGAVEARNTEDSLPSPRLDWRQIMKGGYTGEMENWQAELESFNEAYNERFEQAIEKARNEGAEVSRDDFAFPDWNGTTNYRA